MARDLLRCRTILVIGIGLCTGLSACDRGGSLPSTDRSVIEPVRESQPADTAVTTAVAEPSDEIDSTQESRPPAMPSQQVFRPDDRRPYHDDALLKEAGIQIYESTRLKLYTDIDAEVAQSLPPLIDQVYPVWQQELGPLSPDLAGTEFQMTGYLIRDLALFRELGLVPEELVPEHGRHLRNEFWMREQAYDYYRRHLLIHEATHCYMTFQAGFQAPVWYLEGMAEYFAAHHLDQDHRASFGVMPTSPGAFAGFGRIPLIREDVATNNARSISSICAFQPREFNTTQHYAWSWALCLFLDQTPRYHKRFQALSGLTQGTQFPQMFLELFRSDERDLTTEWTLFSFNLQYGYDMVRAAIDFRPGTLLTADQPERLQRVAADRGWQSSEVRLESGEKYEVVATGQFVLGNQPKPWVSEPQGITFRYFDKHPIGTLLGCIRTEEGAVGGANEPMLQVIPLGRGREFEASATGTLYLRLNEAWNSLHDNQGHATVVIRRVERP